MRQPAPNHTRASGAKVDTPNGHGCGGPDAQAAKDLHLGGLEASTVRLERAEAGAIVTVAARREPDRGGWGISCAGVGGVGNGSRARFGRR